MGDPVEIPVGAQIGMARNQIALDNQIRADRLAAAQAAADRAQAAVQAQALREQQAAAATALLRDLGVTSPATSTPSFGPPVANPQPVLGGTSAWGGTVVGTSTSPGTVSGGGLYGTAAKVAAKFAVRGGKVAWRGGRWIFERADKYILKPVGTVLTAKEIWDWATDARPDPPTMPSRIETRYEFGGNVGMMYRHFDGSWQVFPPAGYNQYGRAMWGKAGPDAQ